MLTTLIVLGAIGLALWEWRRGLPTTGAGASAERHARALRTPLVRLADALGIKTAAGARAGRFAVAAESEKRSGRVLDQLTREGWAVLHDRQLKNANVDHVLINPAGDVHVGDTKRWSARDPLTVQGGRLLHGRRDVTHWLDGLKWEAEEVARLLGLPKVRVIVFMDGAPLHGPTGRPAAELRIDGIRIVPAHQATAVLRQVARIPGQRSRSHLVALAEQVLPPHTGR
ncbi:nuclease-related domain-containing protein [Streptomyces sp. NPDC088847]|uniref:nuclease-related domain-containing protein n=1 Tax=Streptomyces sp. NPDC088847 TaxID=3365909 RepID=UPI00381ABB91